MYIYIYIYRYCIHSQKDRKGKSYFRDKSLLYLSAKLIPTHSTFPVCSRGERLGNAQLAHGCAIQ